MEQTKILVTRPSMPAFDEYMKEKGLIAPNFITTIKVVKAKEDEKKLLNSTNDYLLRSTSVRFTEDKKPVQMTYSMISCEQYEYTFYSFEQ